MTKDRDAFLDRFFGEGNVITRHATTERPELAPLVARLEAELAVPVVLPRRRDSQSVDWYVLARDEQQLRTVQEEVAGFIGPAYAVWDGQRAVLDREDPVDRAVAEFTDDHALRLTTRDQAEFRRCWEAVQLMHRVWAQRPIRRSVDGRTPEVILRDFELTLANGDTTRAAAQIEELQRRGALSAENARFLEIRRLAAQGMWLTIVQHPELRTLASRRRPWLVTDALVTALWHTELAPLVTAQDLSPALRRTRVLVAENPELYAARGPLHRPEVVMSFALRYAVDEQSDAERILRLRDEPGLGETDREIIRRIAAEVETPVAPGGPLSAGRDALEAGDVDRALDLLATAEIDSGSVALMVECAFELATLTAAEQALAAYAALHERDQAALRRRRLVARALDDLEALVQPAASGERETPSTWTAWLERLLDDPGWRAAEAVAICGELEFSASDLAGQADVASLADLLLRGADSDRRQIVLDAFPRVVRWLDGQSSDASSLRPLYSAMLTVVALDTSWADSALELAYNLADDLLAAGLDADGYRDLLDQLELVWDRMAARTNVPWLVDALEMLEDQAGDKDQLLAFALGSVESARSYLGRVSSTVRAQLSAVLHRLGAPDALPDAVEAEVQASGDLGDAMSDRLIGLYTLTPQVAVRARQGILRAFPKAIVEHNDDHVATDALLQLARSADVMIVSIRSAKHAATDAIAMARPPGSLTLFPRAGEVHGSSRHSWKPYATNAHSSLAEARPIRALERNVVVLWSRLRRWCG